MAQPLPPEPGPPAPRRTISLAGVLRHARRRRAVDRYLGWVIAIQLVPMGLLAMVFIRVPRETPPDPLEMMVLYEMPEPPEPEPEPDLEEQPPPPPPLAPEVVATRRDSQEDGELILDPRAGTPDEVSDPHDLAEAPAEDPAPVALEDWVPTTDEAEMVAEKLSDVAAKARQLLQRQQQLQERIVVAEVKSAARQFDLDSDGGLEGAIRMIDVGRYPDDVIKPIFERYGIQTERRFTRPTGGRGFINAAATERGTFRNVEREGFFDVMILSPKAIHFMSTAETEALVNRGYNPRTTRVRKITFGVIERSGELELGVTELEVEQIR